MSRIAGEIQIQRDGDSIAATSVNPSVASGVFSQKACRTRMMVRSPATDEHRFAEGKPVRVSRSDGSASLDLLIRLSGASADGHVLGGRVIAAGRPFDHFVHLLSVTRLHIRLVDDTVLAASGSGVLSCSLARSSVFAIAIPARVTYLVQASPIVDALDWPPSISSRKHTSGGRWLIKAARVRAVGLLSLLVN